MRGALVLAGLLLIAGPLTANPWQPFTALALSPDGQFLATGGMGGEVLWWELSTGEVLGRWQLGSRPIAAVAFDRRAEALGAITLDSKAYRVSGPDHPAQDMASGGEGWSSLSLGVSRWLDRGAPMSGVQISPEDSTIQGFPDGRILIRRAGGPDLSWQAHQGAVTGLALTSGSAVLVSCSYDGALALWDSETGELLARL